MDGVLSQEEISALLSDPGIGAASADRLTDSEKDAIGEISNISMGTAATTLFSLVNRKVEISTPVVSYATWEDLSNAYERPCVFIRIAYTEGLDGSNVLVLKDGDVKIITDLMMGGDGTNISGELGELHLSAISEAMNQMMGSAATSLSSMLNRTIDISPPIADLIDLKENFDESTIDEFLGGEFVRITFRMEIGDLVDSEIMQLYPVSLAREMCEGVTHTMEMDTRNVKEPEPAPAPMPTPVAMPDMSQPMMGQPMMAQPMMGQPMMGQPMMGQPMMGQPMMAQPMMAQTVNVQPAQFGAFTNVPVGVYQGCRISIRRTK